MTRRSILDRLPPADEENETWKAIPGYEGFYEASNRGRIRGLPREVGLTHPYGGAIKHQRRGLEMAAKPTSTGRLYVCLCRESEAHSIAVANIVLETFGEPRPPDCYAAPIDGDPNNCAVENLVWRQGQKRRVGRGGRAAKGKT